MTSFPSVLKSAALIAGLSAIALSQATVPQLYVLSAIPGDPGLKQATVIPVAPLTLTRKDGRLYLGIDPAALGVKVMLNDTPVGTTNALKLVSGPGIVVTAIQSPTDASITVQMSVDGGCTFDVNRNSVCPGSVTMPNGGVPPNILVPHFPPQ